MSSDGDKKILLAHGGGGRAERELLEKIVLNNFSNDNPAHAADAAIVDTGGGKTAFTTDSFVIRPRKFPGGDIGKLAVCGTVNDLAVVGARAVALSCALIIEEGFSIEELTQILLSMRKALDAVGASVVTGDTKVVERGAADGIFINTAGVGVAKGAVPPGIGCVKPGDAIIVSGPVGDHGATIMAVRAGFEGESVPSSDCAPVIDLVEALLEAVPETKFMRDPTRGGLAATLNELAAGCGREIEIDEQAVPVNSATGAVCEILGIDPFHLACEGRFVAVVPGDKKDRALAAIRNNAEGTEAAIIGEVLEKEDPRVILKTAVGGKRILDQPAGEPVPRIC